MRDKIRIDISGFLGVCVGKKNSCQAEPGSCLKFRNTSASSVLAIWADDVVKHDSGVRYSDLKPKSKP
tara:strand:+ start:248 stop:451 length:204 start_codon:yes stop_codon:yes gene_type:complete